MGVLSDQQVASYQSAVLATMPETVTVSRQTTTSDGHGGKTATWSVVATCPGRVGALKMRRGSGDEQLLAGLLTGRTPYLVTVPAGVDVRLRDRLQVAGITVEVIRAQTAVTWNVQNALWTQEVAA